MEILVISLFEYFGKELTKFTKDVIISGLKGYNYNDVKNAIMTIIKNNSTFPQNPLAEIINIIDPPISPELFIADMFKRKSKGHAGYFTVKQKEFYKSLGCTWEGLDNIPRVELKFQAKEYLKGLRKSDDSEQDASQHRLIEDPDNRLESGGMKLLEDLNLKTKRIEA